MKLEYDFEGRTAFVTGGSHGIGRATVESLSDAGARVHFTFRTREDEARAVAARPSRFPAVPYPLDVRDPDAVDALVREIVKEEGHLDMVVNNAGLSRDFLLGEMTDGDFDDVIETNLLGPFYVMRAACRSMMRRRSGAIVNISSVAGRRPDPGLTNYAASKAGLNALTRALSIELAPRGIRVNAVAPGIFPITDQTSNKVTRLLAQGLQHQIHLRRFGELKEAANAVLWLLSDAASYVTGSILDVSGGYKT